MTKEDNIVAVPYALIDLTLETITQLCDGGVDAPMDIESPEGRDQLATLVSARVATIMSELYPVGGILDGSH